MQTIFIHGRLATLVTALCATLSACSTERAPIDESPLSSETFSIVGDGVLDGSEDCDDGNTASADGCDASGQIEDGFVCRTPGTPCVATVCNVVDFANGDRLMGGNFVEIGAQANGAFGTADAIADANFHPRTNGGNGLGFVSDTEETNWTAYHGDFFTPGSHEEGWGVKIGVLPSRNNNGSGSLTNIAGSFGSAVCQSSGLCAGRGGARMSWSSSSPIDGLEITKDYTIVDGGIFVLAEVTLENVSLVPLTDVYYMRNVDPDNDQTAGGSYSTVNTVVTQADGGAVNTISQVEAVQTTVTHPGISADNKVSLVADDERARVYQGGFANRDPSTIWNANQSAGSTNGGADTAIAIAFKFDTIAVGESVTFKYAYNLETDPTAALACAGDNDGDGEPDDVDPDDDDDGVCDDGSAVAGICVAGPDPSPLDSTVCRDLDTDGCDDCAITQDDRSGGDVNNDGTDTDGDGQCDLSDPDIDGDGVDNDDDDDPLDPNVCLDDDFDGCDDCTNTGADGSGGDPLDDGSDTDFDGECDLGDSDIDNDGVDNGSDTDPLDPNVCSDGDLDGCDDCINTGDDGSGGDIDDDGDDLDFDGTCDAGDTDIDGDGVPNGLDDSPNDPNSCRDVDTDGCDDCAITGDDESGGNVNNDGADVDGDGICDLSDSDSDNDGVDDSADPAPLDPLSCGDSDSDTCDDCAITGPAGSGGTPANDGLDTDGDGLCDAGDSDSDNDGVDNGSDSAPLNPNQCRDSDGDSCDDCANTGADNSGGDASGDGLDSDGDGFCDLGDPDSDNDGVCDGAVEVPGTCAAGPDSAPLDANQCQDADSDTCDECAAGTLVSVADDGTDTDSDGTCDQGDLDDDNDGVPDLEDNAPTNAFSCRDLDSDGCEDCAVTGADGSGGDVANDGEDQNSDGFCDVNQDADDDGILDADDLDDDNDGIPDLDEGSEDTDNDGVIDSLDLDSDNDGILDVVEAGHGALDVDQDGVVDCAAGFDAADNGLCDDLETSPESGTTDFDQDGNGPDDLADTDNDGVSDFQDLDSDNDGVFDLDEGGSDCPDVFVDGVCDGSDLDRDGIVDTIDGGSGFGDDSGYDAPSDSDDDGTPDYQELDSDGDGISDHDEAGASCADQTLRDGICDAADADMDGLPDDSTAGDASDTDSDGIPDYQDLDSDNDGIPDRVEGEDDSDGDGLPDYRDLDSDNDGLLDLVEGGSGCLDDLPSDGVCDGPDADGDGAPDDALGEAPDTDGDGVPDFQDLDSDNDGITDIYEGGSGCLDQAPLDGVCDGPDGDSDGVVDSIDDILGFGATPATPLDTDLDGAPDYRDLDSDNDGLLDAEEGGSGCDDSDVNGVCDGPDSDGDGVVDSIDDSDGFGDGSPTVPTDTDGTDGPDFVDGDSNNDGIPDVDDSGCIDTTPMDDVCDGPDSDGDGIVDQIDKGDGFGTGTDTDRDGVSDAEDLDDDGDGILDSVEGDGDTDDDGIPDLLDLDSDNDGISDLIESQSGCVDSESDGVCDGPDSDGDGVADDGGVVPIDTDGDGARDFQDLDSDNDGILDIYEGQSGCIDTSPADGVCDGGDSDRDGIVDSIDPVAGHGGSAATPRDSDGDFIPDYVDLDSDNDGLLDLAEGASGCLDEDENGVCDMPDGDGDGIVDSIDESDDFGNALAAPPIDTDNDGIPDYLDPDSNNDGVSDVEDADCENINPEDEFCDGSDSDGDGIVDSADGGDGFGSGDVDPGNLGGSSGVALTGGGCQNSSPTGMLGIAFALLMLGGLGWRRRKRSEDSR